MINPLGSKGVLTSAFAQILRDMWQQDLPSISPYGFRVRALCCESNLVEVLILDIEIGLRLREAICWFGTTRQSGIFELPTGRIARGPKSNLAKAVEQCNT